MTTYTLVYPPAHNDTYVKATSKFSTSYWQYYATDPSKSLTGTRVGTTWISSNAGSERFHIDLGGPKVTRRIYYENSHNSGAKVYGAKNFTFWGSNNAAAFAELTYETDTNWTQLTTATSVFEEHVLLDQADPKYILVTNTIAYRYYAFKIIDDWAGGTAPQLRRIVLMTEDGFDFVPSPIFF